MESVASIDNEQGLEARGHAYLHELIVSTDRIFVIPRG